LDDASTILYGQLFLIFFRKRWCSILLHTMYKDDFHLDCCAHKQTVKFNYCFCVRVYYKPRLWLEFWNLRWWCNKMLTQQSRQLLKGFMSMRVEWFRLNNVPQRWTKTKGNRCDVLHDLLFNSRRKKEETTYFSSLLRFCSMVGMISTKKIGFEVCFFQTFYLSTPNEGFFPYLDIRLSKVE
jgi:hypothetical protein